MANYNPNRVKINRSYTLEEVAALYGVHKNTVATWVKKGLPCMTARRPFLILGVELKGFIQRQRLSKKQRCKPNELYCVRCKSPVIPLDGFVEYQPMSATKGRLVGFCCHCDGEVGRFAALSQLPSYAQLFDLSVPAELERIRDSGKSV